MPRVSKKRKDGLSIIKTPLFPTIHHHCKAKYKHDILVGIGGNVGDVVRRFERLYHFWVKSRYLCVVESSVILKNPPFGYANQDDFYNAVVHLRSNLDPEAFLRYMLSIERIFGRKRSFKNAPRTLDIDIIFFNMIKRESRFLTLPHPKWRERQSVTEPLEKMKGVSWLKRHL